MTHDKALKLAMDIIKSPPVKWREKVEKLRLSRNDAEDLVSFMMGWITKLVYLQGYVDWRFYNVDTINSNHERATEKATDVTTKVRRAMGYTYPHLGVPNL